MKSQILWTMSGMLIFTGCATMSEDEMLAESGMIPPSANYSPIQAPVYPPLNQPYSPNLLNENDGRVMNIDRLNVGEANLPAPNVPNALPQAQQPTTPQTTPQQQNFEAYEEYVSDYPQEYTPSYIAPSEVVPYEQTMPQSSVNPQAGLQSNQMPYFDAPNPSANLNANQSQNPPMPPIAQNPQINPVPNQAHTPNMGVVASCYYEPCPQAMPQNPPMIEPQPPIAQSLPEQQVEQAPNLIPNSPVLKNENVIELSAVGMGVAPENTISPSQALALAKRAAIIDAYRQIGEKMYGIKINGKDTVKDMILTNSVVKAQVDALIKNADIVETIYKDGLCQVTMELKLDGRTWSRILASN